MDITDDVEGLEKSKVENCGMGFGVVSNTVSFILCSTCLAGNKSEKKAFGLSEWKMARADLMAQCHNV